MKLSDLNLDKKYTYADYVKWTFDEAVELIKGRIFKMAVPLTNHQGLSGNLVVLIKNYLKGTASKDVKVKFEVYEESGVKEYWIVSLSERFVNVFRLNEQGKYVPDNRPYVSSDNIRVGIFSDFSILVDDIFEGLLDFED